MEIQLNVVLLGVLAVLWASQTASLPEASLLPNEAAPLSSGPGLQVLMEMEDEFAHRPDDVVLARRLARTYLELGRPGLAIASLRAAEPELLEHPMVAHHLARAYEASGRVLDALATADLALARCARAIGDRHGPSGTPVPRFSCDARQHAMLTMHHGALVHMAEWGVAQPSLDGRTARAYDLAMRRARIASAY